MTEKPGLMESLLSEITGVPAQLADRLSQSGATSRLPSGEGDVRILGREVIGKGRKGTLSKVSYAQRTRNGEWHELQRDIFENGDSAALLPYDPARSTVLLTRQLRLPVYLQDNSAGMIEAAAGKLDGAPADERMIKEALEEMGLRVGSLEQLFRLYMSPASVAERITFFLCTYGAADRVSAGGGLADEGEFIDVMELDLFAALDMVASGEIHDAKTVILLQTLAARLQPSSGATTG